MDMNFNRLKRTLIVAEAGVNHEGDIQAAMDLIRMAARCGVDAVKFQTYEASHYVSTVQPERLARVRRFELPYTAFKKLAELAASLGLTFFSTPLGGPRDVDFLDTVAPIFKISSGDLTHHPLLRKVAGKAKPIILSTGLGTRQEIQAAIDTVLSVYPAAAAKGELMLMHCVCAYPTPMEEANLANIEWLRKTFGLPVGYSDHTLGIKAVELAVAAGAIAVEKHFTLQKENRSFHDHHLSANPEEMHAIVAAIRTAEAYLGDKNRSRTDTEKKMFSNMRRSVGAAVDIPEGQPLVPEMLTFLRPALGVPVEEADRLIGKCLKRFVPAGDLIYPEDVR